MNLTACKRGPILSDDNVSLIPSPYEETVKRAFKLKWEAELRKIKRLGTVRTDQELVAACKRFAARYDQQHMTCFSKYVVENYDSARHITVFSYTGRVL